MSWRRALRAVAVAAALLAALVFVAGNFVLVDLRLFGIDVETRLAWAVVVPAALSFLGGLLYARARRVPRSTTAVEE